MGGIDELLANPQQLCVTLSETIAAGDWRLLFLLRNRIEAACLPSNGPSKAVLHRVGFYEEGYARQYLKINGLWEDHLLFAMLASDRRT